MPDELSPAAAPALPVVTAAPVVTPEAPSPSPASTPVVEAKVEAPVVEAPKAEAPVVEAPKVEAAPEAKPHTAEETLLESIKPTEAKVEEQPQAVALQPYQLPENVKLDATRLNTFNELLTKAELDPQARGQALVNMHIEEMNNYDKHLRQAQHDVFANTRKGWREEATKDAEMGGSGWETSLQRIAEMRDMFVAEKDRPAFNDFLRVTGAGDHPQFLKLLYNVARRYSEPAPVAPPFTPPPDIGRKPGGGRRVPLYDHPTSNRERG